MLRNLLGKTLKPSVCISHFISTGTEIGNRSLILIFVLTCKYLGASKKIKDGFLFLFWYLCIAGEKGPHVRIKKKNALNYNMV